METVERRECKYRRKVARESEDVVGKAEKVLDICKLQLQYTVNSQQHWREKSQLT